MSIHFQKRAAFTLIELLVVVSVIAVLAGVDTLIPTDGRKIEWRAELANKLLALL